MVPSIRDARNYHHASYSRSDDWNACCARAMGYDEDWEFEETEAESETAPPTLQVTNLLPSSLFEEEPEDHQKPVQDPWMENAMNIQADLDRMARWIQSKKWLFIGFDSMDDAEASLIQSTVTSFAATTANDIESLRKMTQQLGLSSSNQVSHRTGIFQILLARLKDEVVEPFGALQKHRSREAVRLWQNPLQCKLLVKRRPKSKPKPRNEIDQVLGLDDDEDGTTPTEEDEIELSRREQRFLPSRDAHQWRRNFMDTYHRDEQIRKQSLQRPKSFVQDPLSALSKQTEMVFASNPTTALPNNNEPTHLRLPITPTGLADYHHHQSEEIMSEAAHQQMQQEAVLLQNMAHSDLDSVQKMEQQMVLITKLLTQFSELVSEQQEDVWQIHEAGKETKHNMEKGQETLVDAAEKTQNSKHYMAKGIFALGCLLLVFHWLRP